MADMPTDFWAGWIIVLTAVSVLGFCWLVFSIYFSANREEQDESPVWDETLSEGDNPAPMWWFWMTLAALVITVIYLMLYPGLGSFSGTLKWSQHGRLDHSFARYNAKFSPLRKNILKRPIAELQNNNAIMESAQRVYVQNCAACHGLLGEGNSALGASNLTDDIWLYGSSDDALHQTIASGRSGVMPAFGDRLDATQIRMLVAWLMPEAESTVEVVSDTQENVVVNEATEENAALGKQISGEQIYTKHCVACHQSNGEGLPGVFPPLKNNEVVLADDASEHIDIVLNGLKDKVISGVSYSSPMSGFGALLNDEEVAAVVNHERSQWGNDAVKITSDAVAARR